MEGLSEAQLQLIRQQFVLQQQQRLLAAAAASASSLPCIPATSSFPHFNPLLFLAATGMNIEQLMSASNTPTFSSNHSAAGLLSSDTSAFAGPVTAVSTRANSSRSSTPISSSSKITSLIQRSNASKSPRHPHSGDAPLNLTKPKCSETTRLTA